MDVPLEKWVGCHSTPGDESEVRDLLETVWRAAGWTVRRHGAYAVSAVCGDAPPDDRRPVMLICAHMDSPGYSVDRLRVESAAGAEARTLGVTELGTPDFEGRVPAVLKTKRGRFAGWLFHDAREAGDPDVRFELDGSDTLRTGVRTGDRICFTARFRQDGNRLSAPFLDNRLGCRMLMKVAQEARAWQTPCRVVVGATACEEMGGFGAPVLAAAVRPDLALVLDATYESAEQDVKLGGGPVLTLSDAAVALSPQTRDAVLALMETAGVPLQTEVYNFSGTDARAFPHQGLPCPVLPLLIPTRGNHSPCETADVLDFEAWSAAIRVIAERFRV